MVPRDTMTVLEAATYLEVDTETLTRLASARRIPCRDVEGQWMFSKKSLDKWRQRHKQNPPAAMSSPSCLAPASSD